MTPTPFDFAVVGSTPLARLLAGLLASTHGKRVVLVGESQSGFRLPRGIDLSIAPITRPESWALLRALVPETVKLLSRIGGRRNWSRVNPILFAEHAPGQEGLAHIQHMALAFGQDAEPLAEKTIGSGRAGLLIRDAVLFHRAALEVALDKWLLSLGVLHAGQDLALTMHANARAELSGDGARLEIERTVLADDMALLDHLPVKAWPPLFGRQATSTIYTEPAQAMAASVMFELDTGLVMTQQPNRAIVAIGPERNGHFAARVGFLLGRERAFRQAGQSRYERVVTTDNAPAIGQVAGDGPWLLAGFGPEGAFLAPAIARWLAGTPRPAERDWFAARQVGRAADASTVAELGAAR